MKKFKGKLALRNLNGASNKTGPATTRITFQEKKITTNQFWKKTRGQQEDMGIQFIKFYTVITTFI